MTAPARTGRLSTLAAACVIARRDFTAILFSRAFFFFLLGPLFPLLIGGLAGGIGREVASTAAQPELGVAMPAADAQALLSARQRLEPQLGSAVPKLVVVKTLRPDERFDAAAAMRDPRVNLAAVLTGSLERPVLTGPAEHGAAHLRREGFVQRIANLGGDLCGEVSGGFSFEGGIAAGEAASAPSRASASRSHGSRAAASTASSAGSIQT